MADAYLGLGSNVDAPTRIRIALDALREQFGEIEESPWYRSEAVGFDGDDFINLAVHVETELDPLALRAFLRNLETANGRDRNAPKWSDRTLDIDILLYDDLIIYDDFLEIPRKEILKFSHVLRPLSDLAGDMVHPIENATMAELATRLGLDESSLQRIPSNQSPLAG